jgi:hypothetical protein
MLAAALPLAGCQSGSHVQHQERGFIYLALPQSRNDQWQTNKASAESFQWLYFSRWCTRCVGALRLCMGVIE